MHLFTPLPFVCHTHFLIDWCLTGRRENQGAMAFVNSLVCFLYRRLYLPLNPRSQLSLPADHETALSAVRNLNNVDVGGRPLRIDLADSDPFLEGKTTVRGELIDGGETRAQWRERENAKRDRDRGGDKESDGTKDRASFLRNLPQGVPVPPGTSTLDMISQTLATMNPAQLVEVLAQFKVRLFCPHSLRIFNGLLTSRRLAFQQAFVITHPDQARGLLVAHPQLAYALFQALLLNKIVDPVILQVCCYSVLLDRFSSLCLAYASSNEFR